MKSVIRFAATYPRWVLTLVLVISVSAALLVPRLEVRIAAEAMMGENDPLRVVHEENVHTFGMSDAILVVIHDANLSDPKMLAAIREVVDALESLPFVAGTDSLFTVKQGRLNEDEVVEFSPSLDPIPLSKEAAERALADALTNPFVVGNLLARDGRTMSVAVRLNPRGLVEPGGARDRAIVEGIEAVIAPLRGVVDDVFALGLPHLRTTISSLIVHDQSIILPISLVALLLVLLIALGRWEGMILPLLTALASIIWTLAFMVLAGISVNVMTSVAPLLLVVVGSTEDIHLLTAYLAATRKGLNRAAAVDTMAASTGLAVLLTFTTTYLGFFTTTLNDIGLLREFGLVVSTGLLFNFAITTLVVPAVLVLFGAGPEAERQKAGADRYQRLARWLYQTISRRRRFVAAVSLILVVIALIGAGKLRVSNNTLDFFPDDSPIIEQSQQMHLELAGMHSFDVVLASGVEGTFERVRYLQEVEKLQHFLDASGRFDRTQSFADMIKEINRVMEGLPPGERYLPDEDAIVREFLLFANPAGRRPYVSEDLSRTRITVRHNTTSSRELREAVDEINSYVEQKIDPGLTVTVSGESILTQRAGDALAIGQAKALMLMVLTIFLIITALFVNPKAGALAVAANILPIAILFGVMGFAGIPLNMGTAMVAAIAIGICVDDALHFLVRYNQEMVVRQTAEDAILATMEEEARPIMSTSLALALGFGVLALSSFPPVVHFGLLGALVILLALMTNFTVTPILLSYVRLVTVWDVLGVQVKSKLMADCELFRGMCKFQVRQLIAMSTRRTYDTGQRIVRQGDESRELFVILDGRVQAQRRETSGEKVMLNTMGIGDIFGEVALTANTRRSADVVTLEKTEVLALCWEDLKGLARFMPRTSSRLLLNIAGSMGQRLITRKF